MFHLKRYTGLHVIYIFASMSYLSRVYLLLLLLPLCLVAHGQDPYYTAINKSAGLPSNSVYDIFQDSKGFIWIAGDEGLSRYDGYEFRTYASNSQTSRAGNKIEEDMFGRIWYKNFDGYLYYVEHDTLKALRQDYLIGNTSYAIIKDRIFTLSTKGVKVHDLRTMKLIKTISMDLSSLGADLHYKDHFYLSTKELLCVVSYDEAVQCYSGIVYGIMAGSENGIVMSRKGRTETVADRVFCVVEDGKVVRQVPVPSVSYIQGLNYCDNKYWLYTPNGVWAYDTKGNNINEGRPFFGSKNISSVMKDKDGNYWFGTLDEGILFVPDLNTRLTTAQGVTPNVLLHVNNALYLGTKDNGVYSFDIATNNFRKLYQGNVKHEIRYITADTVNKLFMFTSQDFVIADARFKVLKESPNAIKDIASVDRKYCAITGSGLTGLYRLREDGQSVWDSMYAASTIDGRSDLIGTSRGKTIEYEPVNNAIYTGSNKGFFKITPHSITEIKTANGSPVYAQKLMVYKGHVYFITPQNTLGVLQGNDIAVPVVLGEGNEHVYMVRTAGDNLYVLTSAGIRMLDTNSGKFVLLHTRPGIRSEEINDLEMMQDKLVLASDRGIIVIDQRNFYPDTAVPGFIINRVSVNGVATDASHLTDLAYKENDIEVSYSILSFSTGSRFVLQYKLNKGNWTNAVNTTRSLKLASLSPGAYELSFRLRSETGRICGQNVLLFSIRKPFWTEWWFWTACFGCVATAGFAYYKWQTSILKKKNALIVEKMELEKNLRNSMLTSIRAQMNPHFFYNALNTIQSFIFSDEKRNASTYLVKLSRLTRMILEMSEKEAISLDEETEALKLYLELEKMRFNNDFNYEISIGNDVDVELIKIPSMIVQPYVENAVKHGLLHKKGNKHLLIDFRKNNGNLCVTIDDNGIGRAKAEDMKKVKKEKHLSFATDANSKRIELLNKERSKTIGIVYVDKVDEDCAAAGTTVIISIPLN